MSINVSPGDPLPVAARVLRFLAALLAREPKGARFTRRISDSTVRHDIGLDREHQEYASGHGQGSRSRRALHARAERIAAGLPE